MFNPYQDLYETPEWLVEKMIDRIQIRHRSNLYKQNILEPSAGKGTIAKTLVKKMVQYGQGYVKEDDAQKNIDVIEINTDLQHILTGENFKVIHDDFLSFNSFKPYDVIFANFPFSEGEKHIQKAIELQERLGGQIVCLVNAETIRNPFSNRRKEIVQKLEHYEADIEYISDAFADSERSTNVEVALISLSIPSVINADQSFILKQLEGSKRYDDNRYSDEIISGNEIDGLCESYMYTVQSGIKLIEEYYRLSAAAFNSGIDSYNKPLLVLKTTNLSTEYDFDNRNAVINDFIEETRYKYWQQIFNSKSIESLMTNDVRYSLSAMMMDLRAYDVSKFNINKIRKQLIYQLNDSIEDAIVKMFDELTRYAYDDKNVLYFDGWKTNKGWKLGKKAIIRLNAYCDYTGRFDLNYRVDSHILELHKVLSYLCTGKTRLDLEAIKTIIEKTKEEKNTKNIDFGYFKLTFYKKGTTHIEFTDQRLIERFNIFVGKKRNWLPPTYGKKEYYNMSPEEKEVINNFQDELSYERCRKDDEVQRLISDHKLLLAEAL